MGWQGQQSVSSVQILSQDFCEPTCKQVKKLGLGELPNSCVHSVSVLSNKFLSVNVCIKVSKWDYFYLS